MSKFRIVTSFFLTLLLTIFVAGCGQETATVADSTRPVVTSTNPAAGATGVSLTPPITATFSKPMNPTTINAATFRVTGPGGAAVNGTVAYSASGSVATFTPASALSFNTTYLATITTGAQDQATPANSLLANYVWSFTTSPTPAPPTVIATNPSNGATNVAVNQAVTATFSTAMAAASINAATYRVTGPGGAIVPGVVTYSSVGNIATFRPTTALAVNTTYVGTVTTGAQDVNGTGLAANYVWAFTTVAAPTPPTVLSTNPLSNATGVPVNQVVSATFSKAMNAATINGATFTVAGPSAANVAGVISYSAATNTATFTPSSNLATGSTYIVTITTGAQDTTGTGLVANYVWAFTTVATPTQPTVLSTNPVNNATGVPVTQAISAVFSKAMNAATINGATFTVAGPGAANIAGAISYSTATNTATFTPSSNLATGSTYIVTITTGAQDTGGNGLTANYVWAFRTVAAPAAPTVLSTTPLSNATGVPVNQVVSAAFSKAMNAATINAATFTVTGPGSANVAGLIGYSSATNSATFTPSNNLATGATYIVTITTGAQDTTGSALAANYVWAFRTVAAPAPPTVIVTDPANNATGVPFNQKVAATFSSAMNAATINGTSFLLTAPGGVSVPGTVTYMAAGSVATFSPTTALLPDVTYVATVTTGAQDTMGTALASNYVWAFTTGAAPDTTKPTVISTLPLNGATSVPFNQAISATFSKAMNAATITSSNFTLTGEGGTPVAGLVSYAAVGNNATFTPLANLAPSTLFTATITTGVTDLAGNSLLTNYVWTFMTGAAPDTTRPTLTSTVPTNFATGVALNQPISANFSEAMNPLSITNATFQLTGPGGTLIAATITYNPINFIATLQPTLPLLAGSSYIATVTNGATDLAGNTLASGSVPDPWTFTTVATSPVLVLPTVTSTTPLNGATGVPVTQAISAVFSKAMNPATINGATFTVAGPGSSNIAGAITYSAATNTATFVPSSNLLAGSTYIVTITAGAQDTAGNGLAANYIWAFRTVAAPAAPTVLLTNPLSNATGVPVNQVVSATFSKSMNASTINGATFMVTGPGSANVPGVIGYSAATNTATFTPSSNLATGSTYVVTITTGAQDTTGSGLAADYVWAFRTVAAPAAPTVLSTNPLSNATGVPVNQVVSATFSKAMNASTINAATFTVAGPGSANVAGVIGYSSATNTATFTPSDNLTTGATYIVTITTGAQDTTGNGLVANYVWAFRTVAAPAPPTVIITNPLNNATGVPFNQKVAATFSSAMNAATINGTTFLLTAPGGIPVAGTVTYTAAGSVATFSPTAALLPSVTYVATITTGAQDTMGTALASNYVWTFTTGAAPDTTRPTVISTIPLNGATSVPFNQAISATFSEAMNAATINSSNFTLTRDEGTPVAGLVTYAAIGNAATFTPTANLAPSTLFTATITTGVTDLAGNSLLTNYVWTFRTGAAPDTTRPTIVLTVPVNSATGVTLNQAVSATFSEAMNPLSITNATFQLTGPGGALIAATISYDPINFIATLQPTLPLVAGSSYIATVTSGATDLAGNALASGSVPDPWTFATGALVVPPPVNLGTAALFGGFGGAAGMTNDGTSTIINGNIGTTGVSTLITGFHDLTPGCTYTETPLNMGVVNGAIDTAPPPPTVGCPNEGTALTSAIAAQASADAGAAYLALVALPGGLDVSVCPGCGGGSAGELGNRTLRAGVYKSAPGTYGITQGDLVLDAQGNPNAYWVFQAATTLTVGTPSAHRSVLLVNGAQAKNVFWQVGTAATINGILGGGTMTGTIIAQTGVTVSTTGVAAVTTINGRALSLVGPVILDNTVINVPAP